MHAHHSVCRKYVTLSRHLLSNRALKCLEQAMHSMLVDMVHARDAYLLGPDNSGMVNVVRVFAEIVVGGGGGGGDDAIDMASADTM
jgi:hypothetical protein